MEEVVAHPCVAECAVIGHDELKGQIPLALVVTKLGMKRTIPLEQEIINWFDSKLGPLLHCEM
jgi:propionyl-CoA synthetase